MRQRPLIPSVLIKILSLKRETEKETGREGGRERAGDAEREIITSSKQAAR